MQLRLTKLAALMAAGLLVAGPSSAYKMFTFISGTRPFDGETYSAFTESGNDAACCNFNEGAKVVFWDTDSSQDSVKFKLGIRTFDVSHANQITAVQNAIAEWDLEGTEINLNYDGWSNQGHSPTDGYNVIFFTTAEDLDGSVATTLLKVSTHVDHKGEILNADIALHDDADWTIGTMVCGGTSTDKDIESLVVHELGHAIGGAHTGDSTTSCVNFATMQSGAACGDCEYYVEELLTLRSLAGDDQNLYDELYGDGNADGESARTIAGDSTTVAKIVVVQSPWEDRTPLGNFPNPFNAETTIKFVLDRSGETSLSIYNVAGQLVEDVIAPEYYPAGSYQVPWNPEHLASGVYFVRLETRQAVYSTRVVLVQ